MGASATEHGASLFFDGFTVGQVVHDYGDVCQSVTDLAVELSASITSDEFRILNRCLDDAIAYAVVEYGRQQRVAVASGSRLQSMNLHNLITSAITGFEALQTGTVAVGGQPALRSIHPSRHSRHRLDACRSRRDCRRKAGVELVKRRTGTIAPPPPASSLSCCESFF